MKVSVVLVDDHVMVREGLQAVLGATPGITIAATAGDGEAALAVLTGGGAPEDAVCVIDVALPRLNGVELTRRMRSLGLPQPVLLLSMHGTPDLVRAGLEAGALGYVLKDSPHGELVAAIRSVAARRRFIGAGLDAETLAPPRRGEVRRDALAPRERDVLRLVAQGLGNKAIAERLGLTTRTVEWYRATIMGKLGVDSVAGLVRYAIRHQIVLVDE